MDFSNEGQSFYHRLRGSFVFNTTGQILDCTGPHRQWIRENWRSMRSEDDTPRLQGAEVKLYQRPHPARGNTTAILISNESRQPEEAAFEDFFIQLILAQADLCTYSQPLHTPESDMTAERIVDLFDSYLRYEGKDDKWDQGGRAYFAERVRHFTAQNATVEFCLPAFPCKSSNHDKVTGTDPDMGEELALERLHGFVEAIERIYQPGAKLWIISDGHVFSDCIGVDDAAVDAYGEKLKQMNREIGLRLGNPDRVGFKSLVDLFQLASIESDDGFADLARRLNIPEIDHPVETRVTGEAELCRRILMAGCSPRKSAVRAKIDSKDAAITALYRGFSRFMLEDLAYHPQTQRLSRSQQKKLSARVAFEMILRNQAYSNLVEILFPNHVRLSIHAHNNAGPKFGIQLFDPVRVRAVQALSPDGELMTSLDLLHIPTPWHNSVVQLAGSDVLLVTKAKLARAALAAGAMTGGLARTPDGGRLFFALRRTAPEAAEPAAVASAAAAGPAVKPEPETPVQTEPIPAPSRPRVETDGDVTPTAIGAVSDKPQPTRRPTLSEKADSVVAAIVRRRTTGNVSNAGPERRRYKSWLGRLRWILSLFWPRGL